MELLEQNLTAEVASHSQSRRIDQWVSVILESLEEYDEDRNIY